ncbi:MAG: hypothetical protein FWG88_08110 [Oscillospiraceae bacterium]|nr:hypothetical protein [Oscillospiraceae bacterium]
MSNSIIDGFHMLEEGGMDKEQYEKLSNEEKYEIIGKWALEARRRNPDVFDALIDWVLDDSQWSEETLVENEQILIYGIFARFREQNNRLRAYLAELEPSGIVNPAVYKALDRFDDELAGKPHDERLQDAVSTLFADFSAMLEPGIRQFIAGSKTGSYCTETEAVDVYGYINYLKDCDAAVQWALFMPSYVEAQQKGFSIESFEYKKMPALRFIGRESELELNDGETTSDGTVSGGVPLGMQERMELFAKLDTMADYKSAWDFDILLMHHMGLGVDVERIHLYWGRFMAADAPVPEGFISFDFVPENNDKAGLPFVSQFAFATFFGDMEAMHKVEGYDSDAMYDVTRNIILGEGVHIPYPDKYWTAEVFVDGFDKPSNAYMFSVHRD